jgi:hypothetical protein
MTCKNCDNEFEGKYCNRCGQSSSVQRISWRYIRSSIANEVFQINHGFLYTIKTLLIKPGQNIRDFFLGKRKDFYKPFAFLLISTTIFFLSTSLLGNKTFIDEFIDGIRAALNDETNLSADFRLLDFLRNNQSIIILFTVPLFSFASVISFRKSKYNLPEHLILNFYITGIQFLIYSIFSFFIDQDSNLVFGPLVLGLLYNVFVYNQLFNEIEWLKRSFNILLTYLLYIILMFISFVVLVLISLANITS